VANWEAGLSIPWCGQWMTAEVYCGVISLCQSTATCKKASYHSVTLSPPTFTLFFTFTLRSLDWIILTWIMFGFSWQRRPFWRQVNLWLLHWENQ